MIRLMDLPPAMRAKVLKEQYDAADAPKPSKYRNKRVEVDGIKFDSQREADHYGKLALLWKAGEIRWFIRQVPFRLDGGTIYRADFLVVWKDGRISIQDAKGVRTQTFVVKKREVEHKYGIQIEEV